MTLKTFDGADYQKQLPLALSGGESIDVAGVQISAMTNSVKDYLDPAEDWAGDILPTLNPTMIEQTKAIATDGVLYSVPMGSIGSPIMYYNADILDSLGLSVPTTADEWKTAVDAIKAAMPDVTPVVFQGDVTWQEEMLFAIAEQTSPGLSDDIIGGTGSWDQPGMVNGLKAYKSLFDDGIISTDVLSLTGARAERVVRSGSGSVLLRWIVAGLAALRGVPRRQQHRSQGCWCNDVTAGQRWKALRACACGRWPRHPDRFDAQGSSGKVHRLHAEHRR